MIKKIIPRIFPGAVCALLLLWVALSFVDIVADNCMPAPVHSDLNIFVLFLEVFGQ